MIDWSVTPVRKEGTTLDTSGVRVPNGFDAFGPWFNEALDLLKAQFQPWLLMSLIFFAIAGGAGVLLHAVGGLFGPIIWALLMPGMVKAGLKQIRGGTVAIDDLFSGTGLFLGALVIMIASGIGGIACGVGAIVTGALFCLALPLLVDKNLDMGKALETSYAITKQNFMFFLVYTFVMAIVGSIGAIAFGIGIIVTFPMFVLGMVVAYERTVNPAAAPAPSPEP